MASTTPTRPSSASSRNVPGKMRHDGSWMARADRRELPAISLRASESPKTDLTPWHRELCS